MSCRRKRGISLAIQSRSIASDRSGQLAIRTDGQDLASITRRCRRNDIRSLHIGSVEVRLTGYVSPCNRCSSAKRNFLDAICILLGTKLGLVSYIVHLGRSGARTAILNRSDMDPVVLVDSLAFEPRRSSKLIQSSSSEYLFLSARRNCTQRENAGNGGGAEIDCSDVSCIMRMLLGSIQGSEVRLILNLIPGQILNICKNLAVIRDSARFGRLGELLIEGHRSIDVGYRRSRLLGNVIPAHLRNIRRCIKGYLAQGLIRLNQIQIVVLTVIGEDRDSSTRLYICTVQSDICFCSGGRIEYQITADLLQGHILADNVNSEIYTIISRR